MLRSDGPLVLPGVLLRHQERLRRVVRGRQGTFQMHLQTWYTFQFFQDTTVELKAATYCNLAVAKFQPYFSTLWHRPRSLG